MARANALDQLAEPLERQRDGLDRPAAGRLFGEPGDVHVAEGGQHQRARDRRRRHHQHVGRVALGGDRQALVDAEAVLLVDDRQDQVVDRSTASWNSACVPMTMSIAPDAMSSRISARSRPFSRPVRIAVRRPARSASGAMVAKVLAGEDFGRRHQRRLAAGFGGARHREQADHRLAGADIALQQAQHALGLAPDRHGSRPAPAPASRSADRAAPRGSSPRSRRRRSAGGRPAA